MNRDFKGVWMPKEIYLSKILSLREKFLIVEIHSLSNLELGCIASNKYFADFLSVSYSTVANLISDLVKRGIVRRKITYNDKGEIIKRELWINTSIFTDIDTTVCERGVTENSERSYEKQERGVTEISKVINTKINNTFNNTEDIAVSNETASSSNDFTNDVDNSNTTDKTKHSYQNKLKHYETLTSDIIDNLSPTLKNALKQKKEEPKMVGYQEATTHWYKHFKEHTGVDYVFVKEGGKHIKTILQAIGLENFKTRLDNYFQYAKKNDFINDNLSLRHFFDSYQKPFCIKRQTDNKANTYESEEEKEKQECLKYIKIMESN